MTAALKLSAAEAPAFATDVDAWFAEVGSALRERKLAPYLGPGLIAHAPDVGVPTSYEGLAGFFAKNVALPKRARGNPWASAQYVESRQHRATVMKWMAAAFAPNVAPLPFHRHLAALELPLIVDTWYDSALRNAFEGRSGWLEVQGMDRAKIGEERWFRAYDPAGNVAPIEAAESVKTLLYKPHGSVTPVGNFLVSDADYVEVLTEIDIQTPIPEAVRVRRAELGFVFLGCRFHDQLLRTYARQVVKRSRGPYYAVFESAEITRMERQLLRELGIQAVVCPLPEALDRLQALSS